MQDVDSFGAVPRVAVAQIARSKLLVLLASLKNDVAYYARAMDACYIDDELVRPQPGGSFKAEPGTEIR